MLYLPRPSLDELPEGSRERAIRLREWAVALDGARLHRMLLEVASPRAWVALAETAGASPLEPACSSCWLPFDPFLLVTGAAAAAFLGGRPRPRFG